VVWEGIGSILYNLNYLRALPAVKGTIMLPLGILVRVVKG